ncbi:MAG: DUF3108 domain-containing protein [Rubrivivax sp.]
MARRVTPGWATPRRKAAVVVLAAVVTLLHAGLATLLPDARLGEGAGDRMPRRIEVAYVRELAQAAPPPVAPVMVSVPKPARRVAAPKKLPPPPPEEAASAAEPQQAAPPPVQVEVPPEPLLVNVDPLLDAPLPPQIDADPVAQLPAVASAPTPQPPGVAEAIGADPAASVPVVAAAASAPHAAAVAFEWPPSTLLTYKLTGYYRGDVLGAAMVEWVRVGLRYQVHLDVYIGSQAAPLVARRMTSDGDPTEDGLSPRRYDEETRALLRQVRRRTIVFDAERVLLPNGKIHERMPHMQDAASQFVQLSWLFTTRPELLQTGRTIEVPLALPTNVDRWAYDVLGKETLQTPVGAIEAFHMKPRRELRPGGDLVAEVWFAPSLRYLPVRLLIRQDGENYVDLLLDQLPQEAAQPIGAGETAAAIAAGGGASPR